MAVGTTVCEKKKGIVKSPYGKPQLSGNPSGLLAGRYRRDFEGRNALMEGVKGVTETDHLV